MGLNIKTIERTIDRKQPIGDAIAEDRKNGKGMPSHSELTTSEAATFLLKPF